jgi:hypothetical protein
MRSQVWTGHDEIFVCYILPIAICGHHLPPGSKCPGELPCPGSKFLGERNAQLEHPACTDVYACHQLAGGTLRIGSIPLQ